MSTPNIEAYEKRPWTRFYRPGTPVDVEIPEDQNLCSVFDEATDKWKDKTSIIFYGNKISVRELRDHVDRFATALYELGVRKGDMVAMLMLNSPEYIVAFFAILKVGGIITPISPVYVSPEIKYQLEDSGASTIICHDFLWSGVEKTGVALKNVILCDISNYLPAAKKFMGKSILKGVYQKMAVPASTLIKQHGFHLYHELIKKYPPQPPKIEINPREDIVCTPYTGGTTGAPKGVMLPHYNYIAVKEMGETYMNFLEEGKETLISYMPFYHIAGQMMGIISPIIRGWTQVILTNPNIDDVIDATISYKTSYFYGAPTMFEILNHHEKTSRINWKSMKAIVSGADALMEATAKEWTEATGTQILETFGQTETTAIISYPPIDHPRRGSVGVPVCNTRVLILDPDKDECVPMGELGEVAVEGPQVMKGYWKKPEAFKEIQSTIDGITYMRTGDIARMDEDGYMYIYDRKRDLIKYKGLRIHAREVEEIIKSHPKVKEVGVIGVPDALAGENVKAFVVLEGDARGKISEKEIIDYCQDKLAHYKIPKIVELVGEVPKTDVGKVSRRELREMED